MSLSELTKIYDSKGIDGLTRMDRAKSAKYNRGEFLFEKFLNQRKEKTKVRINHAHILELGHRTFEKFKPSGPNMEAINNEYKLKLDEEIERIENEADEFREQLEVIFKKQVEKERKSTKKHYEETMERIEKQRDQLEDERVKDVIKKMNEECEISLKKQWRDAEDLRFKTLEELKQIARDAVAEEMRVVREKAVHDALAKAEEEFKIREAKSIEMKKQECDNDMYNRLGNMRDKYDSLEEALLDKIQNLESNLNDQTTKRINLEADFRLLQADYKRFMNYTNHYNSDYMMKLRHIGDQVLEDREFEDRLNQRLESIDKKMNNIPRNKDFS